MLSSASTPQQQRLLLVDDDPIFGLGLRTALAEASVRQIMIREQVATAEQALEAIGRELPDLVVLELGLMLTAPQQISGLQFCQIVKNNYPNLPIFLLTSKASNQELLIAYNLGVNGYAVKCTNLEELVVAWSRVIEGDKYWQTLENLPTILPKPKPPSWLASQRQTGIRQIDQNLKQVNKALAQQNLPFLDWLFWHGRKRELRLARWLVNQLLPVELVVIDTVRESSENTVQTENIAGGTYLAILPQSLSIEQKLFDLTLTKIQGGVDNLTGITLEIDILKPTKKKELLYLVYNQIIQELKAANISQIESQELRSQRQLIVRNILQDSSFKFISKYYSNQLINQTILLDLILKELNFLEEDFLDKIPFIQEIWEYFIYQKPFLIDNIYYEYESEEAQIRFELLFHNLIIQIANGVMLIVLNNFLEQEINQPPVYIQPISSSRDIARFRNRLSWKYRREKYLEEPQNIFEDQYRMFYFNGRGIATTLVKSSRKTDLKQLQGIRWLVTLVIEARDAIAPGLQAVIDGVGKTLVYLLTEVIGRGIGLIGKGVIQGIGNSLQETRYRGDNYKGK